MKDFFDKLMKAWNVGFLGIFSIVCYTIVGICALIAIINVITFFTRLFI